MQGIIPKDVSVLKKDWEPLDSVEFDWFSLSGSVKNTTKVGEPKTVTIEHEENIENIKIERTMPLSTKELKSLHGWTFGPMIFLFFPLYSAIRHLWEFFALRIVILFVWIYGLADIAKSAIFSFNADILWQGRIWTFFCLLMYLGAVVWECAVARRTSWNRSEWVSFARYQASEKVWNILGAIVSILLGISLLLRFAKLF